MNTTTFLKGIVNSAMKEFAYYRKGPVPMHKLQPGFIFQQCVDKVLADRGVASVENGLGDHCLSELGLAIQLKTSVQDEQVGRMIFCRSSIAWSAPHVQKRLRISDVEDRIFDMYGATGTCEFVMVHVNLLHNTTHLFQLHDGENTVGNWLNEENVCSPHRQTHFWVNSKHMIPMG